MISRVYPDHGVFSFTEGIAEYMYVHRSIITYLNLERSPLPPGFNLKQVEDQQKAGSSRGSRAQ